MFAKKLMGIVGAIVLSATAASAVTVVSGDPAFLLIEDENGVEIADPGASSLSLAAIGSGYNIVALAFPELPPGGIELQQVFINNSLSSMVLTGLAQETPDDGPGLTGAFLTATIASPNAVIELNPMGVANEIVVNPGSTLTLNWGGTSVDGPVFFGVSVEVAPIPVPAAGVLLLTALGGLGIARRRRRS